MRKHSLFKAAIVVCMLTAATFSRAQSDLVNVQWIGGTGTKNWQDNANWAGGAFPNDSLKTGNLSVNLGANLNVDLGATDVTIAGVTLGSTSGAVTTNIFSSSSGRLLFKNDDTFVIADGDDADFDQSTTVNGRDFLIWQRGLTTAGENLNNRGDANADNLVDADDLVIWNAQYGLGVSATNPAQGYILSQGVAGVTNVINANLHAVNEVIEIAGTRNLTINGDVTYEGDPLATPAGASSAGMRVLTSGMTVTMNGDIVIVNSDAADGSDFHINNNPEAQGTLVVNGLITGVGDLSVGNTGSGGTGTVILNSANTYTGSFRAGRGDLVLNHDNALGVSTTLNDNGTPADPNDDFFPMATYRQNGLANATGYNMSSTNGDRNIPNDITFAQWQSFTGANSFELSGDLSQTNNRGIINLLPSSETVTLSGRMNIWEDSEELERRFTFAGSGKTIISGTVRNDPLDAGVVGDLRLITKTGTGVLLINVDAGDNNHQGAEQIIMGNYHYANNNSLNSYVNAKIQSIGGAVGVDTHPAGQNLGTNTAFLNQIDPTSVGGLMLANSDAAVNLNFTAGSLVNAANMSLAAPETNLSYTGTITPANNTYKLGGGTGTLTLPNAQLTGARSLLVKNGGVVRLLGDNTYTGTTTITTKYTSAFEEVSAGDEDRLYYRTVISPTLEIDDLANGGAASSIGSSSKAASNLLIQGSTLRYVGTGDTTDRLFSIGTGGATLDASGTGAIVFSDSGALGIPDAADKIGSLDDFTGNPNEIVRINDSSDIVVGMPVSDPDAGGPVAFACGGGTSTNCIPAGTTVTGVSNDGKTVGLSTNFGFIWKEDTRLVFGAVARTLTLTGSSTQANILTPVLSDSVKGSQVGVTKQGTGTWYLESVSTNTGPTLVETGTLGGNGGVGGSLTVSNGASFTPGAAGASAIGDFSVGGSFTLSSGAILGIQLGGTTAGSYDVLNVTGAATLSGAINLSAVAFTPVIGNAFTVLTAAGGITDSGLTITGLTGFTKSIVGNSLVLTKTAALTALAAAVPEPSSLVMIGLAMACCGLRRK